VLPHTRVVLHQPAAEGRSAIPDRILQADEVARVLTQLEEILAGGRRGERSRTARPAGTSPTDPSGPLGVPAGGTSGVPLCPACPRIVNADIAS
jgi:hypothetical protein